MALTLAECLREARSIPVFNGENEYSLNNFLRDIRTVLSLTPGEYAETIQCVLANRLQGKALRAVESLVNPSWDQTLQRLREEFGIKLSYLHLRNEAMNVGAANIQELHTKLRNILQLMNSKYYLEGAEEVLYTPINNEKLYLMFILLFTNLCKNFNITK